MISQTQQSRFDQLIAELMGITPQESTHLEPEPDDQAPPIIDQWDISDEHRKAIASSTGYVWGGD